MSFTRFIYSTVLDALFPVSKPEHELFSYSPEQAFEILPSAPAVPISDAYSVFAYKDKRVTRLVWQIKYMKSRKAVSIGGYAIYQTLCNKIVPKLLANDSLSIPKNSADLSGPIILVPIPITPKRRRERGFNQCELLLDEIRRLDQNQRFILRFDLIIRVHHDSRQTLKGRSDRLESAHNIFAMNKDALALRNVPKDEAEDTTTNKNPNDSTVIIIDDVITTGSTMKEAIDTLKKAGFERIYGLSLAH